MFYRNAYGVELGEAGFKQKFKLNVQPAEPKPGALYVAEIIGWREGLTDWSWGPRVQDEDGHALINPNWQAALWWPDADKPGSTPNNTNSRQYPVASTYALESALAGLELRSPQGFVTQEGGPYRVWIDGPDIECPIWAMGWAENHYYASPYLVVRRKGSALGPVTPPITPQPSGSILEEVGKIEMAAYNIRQMSR